jgi:hypothetical protein
MKNGNRVSLPVVVSLVASLAALGVSVGGYVRGGGRAPGGGGAAVTAADLARLAASVDGLKNRVDGIRAAVELTGRTGGGAAGGEAGGTPEGGDADRLAKLEGVVERAGLDKLAQSGQLDPEFLESIHTDYASRKQVSEYRAKILARNEAQHQADAQKFDAKTVSQLYDVARTQGQDSDKALTVLMEQFPEANATGMAIAERALQAAMQADTPSVEEYYTALVKSGAFGEVVTDMGIEAVPSLQHYLIGQYLKEGRVTEAETLLNQMSTGYQSSYVADRGRSGEPEWYPVETLVENLKQEVANASAGGAVGATSGRSPNQTVTATPGGQTGTGPGGGGGGAAVQPGSSASGGAGRPGGR